MERVLHGGPPWSITSEYTPVNVPILVKSVVRRLHAVPDCGFILASISETGPVQLTGKVVDGADPARDLACTLVRSVVLLLLFHFIIVFVSMLLLLLLSPSHDKHFDLFIE